jgi:hypothetical protein
MKPQLSKLVRALTLDNALTFDSAMLAPINDRGDTRGMRLQHNYSYRTYDGRDITVDSTGALLVGELERLDQKLYMPLAEVSWARDVDLREDVSVADEVSSFTLSQFAASSGLGTGAGIRNGKNWISKVGDQVPGISLDIAKVPQPLRLWGMEIKFSIPELESAARAGRPIDDQKVQGMKMKHQMDIDEQVYVGDAGTGDSGLFNHTLVTNVANLPNGALGASTWANKTPAEILADVNAIIQSVWQASGWSVMPNRLLIPPAQFGYISTQLISSAGNQSILKYLLENNILTASGKGQLTIQPAKWLLGAGTGGTLGTAGTVDRMVCYTKNTDYVRYPMTMLQRTPIQYISLWHAFTYYCRLGVLEVVYPETVGYRDGL